MNQRGAQVLAISETAHELGIASGAHVVQIASGLPAWARPVTYLPVLQLMAYYRSLSNGQNPDLPANLSFVIALDKSMT
jgi:glucosamine--fructose-6-phosphate aminotransferase (isomerizing)